jgi:hypothetical protein
MEANGQADISTTASSPPHHPSEPSEDYETKLSSAIELAVLLGRLKALQHQVPLQDQGAINFAILTLSKAVLEAKHQCLLFK